MLLESSFEKLWPSQIESNRIITKEIHFNHNYYSEISIEFGIGMAEPFIIRTL